MTYNYGNILFLEKKCNFAIKIFELIISHSNIITCLNSIMKNIQTHLNWL